MLKVKWLSLIISLQDHGISTSKGASGHYNMTLKPEISVISPVLLCKKFRQHEIIVCPLPEPSEQLPFLAFV